MKMFKISKTFDIKAVKDLKKEPKSKKSEVKSEDKPEDNHSGLFEVSPVTAVTAGIILGCFFFGYSLGFGCSTLP